MDFRMNEAQIDFNLIPVERKKISKQNEYKMQTEIIKKDESKQLYENLKQNNSELEKVTEKTIVLAKDIGTDYTFKRKVVWFNAIGFLVLHVSAVYGLLLCFTSAKLATTIWMLALTFCAAEGITIGAHRLYSHKSFKATPLLRAILLVWDTVAGQNCLYIWARDHRQHHRYSDTDADPHNAMRGFFFSHIGWLMSRKHPAVIKYGKDIDMSDLEADWMVMFQKKYYKTLYVLLAIYLPMMVPVWAWGEDILVSYFVSYVLRFVLQLNATWLVNSAAHLYGTRPYDKTLLPVESWFVSFVSFGEGWHNYHHAFPWDYKASEYGMHFNTTSRIIEFFGRIGLAYDLREASAHMVENRRTKKGDGTHYEFGDAKDEVTTSLNTLLHPLNPSFRSKQGPLDVKHNNIGLPLLPEDLSPEEQLLNSDTWNRKRA